MRLFEDLASVSKHPLRDCARLGCSPEGYLRWLVEAASEHCRVPGIAALLTEGGLQAAGIRLLPGSALPLLRNGPERIENWLLAAVCCPEDVGPALRDLPSFSQLRLSWKSQTTALTHLVHAAAAAGMLSVLRLEGAAPEVYRAWLECWLQQAQHSADECRDAVLMVHILGDALPAASQVQVLSVALPYLAGNQLFSVLNYEDIPLPVKRRAARQVLRGTGLNPGQQLLLRIAAGRSRVWLDMAQKISSEGKGGRYRRLLALAIELQVPPYAHSAKILDLLLPVLLQEGCGSPELRLAVRLHGGGAEVDLREQIR